MYKLELINMTKREAFLHMDVKNAGLCKSVLAFRPYVVGIFSYIGLKNRPYIW